MRRYFFIKCILDYLGAFILLLFVWWVIVICLLIIKLDSWNESPMYIDTRVGKDQKTFKMYKLRTMKSIYAGSDGVLDHTLTTPGRIMRKLSLDEFPQLLNILNGTMSFIGPRPLPTRYLSYYSTYENRRHEVRPGITGLAQINGRANLNWETRFQYDVEYVDKMSFYLDISILLKTIKTVIQKDNIMVTPHSDVTESFDSYRNRELQNERHKKDKYESSAT